MAGNRRDHLPPPSQAQDNVQSGAASGVAFSPVTGPVLLRGHRSRDAACALVLLLLPALLLHECLFGGRRYLPFDLAEFPPVATTLEPAAVRALQQDCNYDATEAPTWFVSELQLARRAFADGDYPHWNPYSRGGAPLAAHGHLGLLNPLHWPALLFEDPADGLLYLTFVMFALAGLLMYGLLRSLGLHYLAALLGAISFELSGTLCANGHWYMRMEPIALLPGLWWMVLCIARRTGRERALPATLLAIGIGLCWTAGFPPFCIPVTLMVAACGLVLVAHSLRSGVRPALGLAGWLAVAGTLGVGLAAVQLWQQVEFFPVSNRPTEPGLESASRFAFDPMGLIGWVLPDAFSHPSDRTLSNSPLAYLLFSRTNWVTGQPLLPNYNFTEYAMFCGTVPLLLAVLGLVHKGPRWRLLCLLGLGVLVTVAMGLGPLRHAFGLPVVESVPPYRFVGPACALVSMLAALGLEALIGVTRPWLVRGVAALALLLAGSCIWLAGPLRDGSDARAIEERWLVAITDHYREAATEIDPGVQPSDVTQELVRRYMFVGGRGENLLELGRQRLYHNLMRGAVALVMGGVLLLLLSLNAGARTRSVWLLLLALLLTILELGWYGLRLNHGTARRPVPRTPVHEFLFQQRDARAVEGGFMVARASPTGQVWDNLPPGTLASSGIRDLHFYSFVDQYSSKPFRLLYGDRFMIRDYLPSGLLDDKRLELPFFDAMGLRYLLSTTPLQYGGTKVGPEWRGPGGEFFVYERPNALPRAWTVPALRMLENDDAMVAAAMTPDLDPRAAALVIKSQVEEALLALIPPAPAGSTQRSIRFVRDEPRRVTIEVGGGAACYLVLADTLLPGWRAYEDGLQVAMVRCNVYQRVLALPATPCKLEFTYFTPGLIKGFAVSSASLLGCFLLLLMGMRRKSVATRPASVVTGTR